jgi:hypothetical protein
VCAVALNLKAPDGFNFQTHPKVNKQLYDQSKVQHTPSRLPHSSQTTSQPNAGHTLLLPIPSSANPLSNQSHFSFFLFFFSPLPSPFVSPGAAAQGRGQGLPRGPPRGHPALVLVVVG